MTLDRESVESLLPERPKGKDEEERDEYDELYHDTRRRLAVERAIRDDAIAAVKGNEQQGKREPTERPLPGQAKSEDEKERDQRDDPYHEARRRLAIERAIRDDAVAAAKGNERRISKDRPRQPLKWLNI